MPRERSACHCLVQERTKAKPIRFSHPEIPVSLKPRVTNLIRVGSDFSGFREVHLVGSAILELVKDFNSKVDEVSLVASGYS